jgi:nicotinamide riboside kinase
VCSGLESKLKQEKIVTDTSKEYARQYINTYGVPTEYYEQMIIQENQETRDQAIAQVSTVMLCDTPAMSCYVYLKRMVQAKTKSERRQGSLTNGEYKLLEEMHTKALKKVNWYDLIIVFPPTDPVIQDGTRTEKYEDKVAIYQALIGFLHSEAIPYVIVEGTAEEKIQKCYDLVKEALEIKNIPW